MATKPPDFKTSGIRAERIIASASNSNPKLLVMGAGATGNDGINVDTSQIILTGTGSDTWLFISGGIGGNDRVTFGGDVYVSGSIFGTGGGGGSSSGVAGSVQYSDGSGGFSSDALDFSYSAANNRLDVTNATMLGNHIVSGSLVLGHDSTKTIMINASLISDIVPDGDRTRNLGSSSKRFANVYTGDLHLRNDRGDWTIVEEADFLCVVNNLTGKRYKMMLQPID